MLAWLLYKWFIIFCILKCCRADENLGWGEKITKLYDLISSAVKNDFNSPPKTRRVFINDSLYQIHLNKLKDVNGLKMHNIVIKRSGPDINSTIYINNPLEAKLPHPFMSLEEFKKTLVDQQVKNREVFMKAKKKAEYSRIWAKIRATAKFKTTRNISISTTNTKSTTEKVQGKKVENKLEPETNILMKITKTNQKVQEPASVKGNTVASKTENVKETSTSTSINPSVTNSRFKLLAIEQHLPIEHKPLTNVTHSNNKTTKNVNIKNEQLIETVNTIKSKLTTSPTIVETTVEKELGTNNAEDQLRTIDEETTQTIQEKTMDKVNEELWTGDNETELTNMDYKTETTHTEDSTTETSFSTTTITTSSTTVPTTTTVRVKWSRPRVLLDEPPTSASTTT